MGVDGRLVGGMHWLYGDDVELDAEVLGERAGVGDGVVGGKPAGHGDADDLVGTEGGGG